VNAPAIQGNLHLMRRFQAALDIQIRSILSSLVSQKFVENLRKVGRSPRLLGAAIAGPQRSRVRRGRGRPPHNEICHEPLGQETSLERIFTVERKIVPD